MKRHIKVSAGEEIDLVKDEDENKNIKRCLSFKRIVQSEWEWEKRQESP